MKKINFMRLAMPIVLLVMCVFFAVCREQFLSSTNLLNIMRQVSITGIVSVGMSIVIITGGLDLSVGSLLAVAGVFGSTLMTKFGMGAWGAFLLCLVLTTLLGFISGMVINFIGLPPMIVTLGMMTSVRGLSYIITGGVPVYGIPQTLSALGKGHVWIIPIPVICMIVVFTLGWLLLEKTYFGAHFYAIGSSAEVARLSGIRVRRLSILAYAINGFLCGIAGVILMYRVNSGQPGSGDGMEMDAITACVLGGIALNGGEGKIWGVFVGVLFIGVLANGLLLLNVSEYYQMLLNGIILVGAVSFDRISQRRRAAQKRVVS